MAIIGQGRKIILSILLILSISSLVRTAIMLWNSNLPDFEVLYNSALLALKHQNPYTSNTLSTPVNYPPIALVLLFPLVLFPLSIASKIWIVISILSLIGTLFVLNKVYPSSWLLVAILFFATVFSFPFKFTLGMGQVNLILLFLIAAFFFFVSKGKNYLAATSLSFAVALKLFPIFLFLPLILKQKWKIISFALAFGFLISVLALIYVGKEVNVYYFQNTLLDLFSKRFEFYYNQSITGFLSRFDVFNNYILLGRLVLIGISLLVIIKKKFDLINSLALFIILILLINHFSWQHHLVLLLLPYYFILRYVKTKFVLFLTVLSYLLTSFNIKHPQIFESVLFGNVILSHGFFGMLLLWIIYIFSARKQR